MLQPRVDGIHCVLTQLDPLVAETAQDTVRLDTAHTDERVVDQ